MSVQKPVIAIIGAGNGGMAFASYLGLKGFPVILSEFEEFDENLDPIRETGVIEATGVLSGTSRVKVAGSIAEAVAKASIVMVTVPAHIHGRLTDVIKDSINRESIIVLNPGRTGGALEVYARLKEAGIEQPVVEAQTLLFACRKKSATSVMIAGIKNSVDIAVMPGNLRDKIYEHLHPVIPQFRLVEDIRSTSLANIGAIFHTSMTLLNASRIDNGMEFLFYKDSATPHVVNIIKSIDQERLAIGTKASVQLNPVGQWLRESYGLPEAPLSEMIRSNPAYQNIAAPTTLNVRYLHEEVPTGLVPLEEIGRMYQVGTPTITSLINLANTLMETDYRYTGRTAKTMKINDMSSMAFQDYIQNG